MHRRIALSLAAVPLTMLGLAACMSEPTAGPGTGPADKAGTESSAPSGTKPQPKDTSAPVQPGTATFKDSYTYSDGIAVEVIGISADTIGQWDVGDGTHPGDTYLVFKVRIKNGSPNNFDASDLQADASYGADGETAPEVYASEKGVDGGFDGPAKITPHHAKSVKLGFAVPKHYWKDVTLEVEPSFEYDSAVFQGSVKGLVH